MARAPGLEFVVGDAHPHRAARRRVVHRRDADVCRAERLFRHGSGCRRSVLAAHRRVGPDFQCVRTGSCFPAAVCRHPARRRRPTDRSAEDRIAASNAGLSAHRGQGLGSSAWLADRDDRATDRGHALETGGRSCPRARAVDRHRGARAERRIDRVTGCGGRLDRRPPLDCRDRYVGGNCWHVDPQFHCRSSRRPLEPRC